MGLVNWIGDVARRFAADARGNVAMIFGLSLPVLIMMTVGGVDIHRASTVRVNLQDALDAATLAAARSPYTAQADIQRVGLAALQANLAAYPDVTLITGSTTFTLTTNKVVVADTRANVKTLIANIVLPPYGKFMDDYLPVSAHSEVNRSAKNLEVALVLDVTGSMAGQRLVDLKAAAKSLIDIVVQPVQTPYYSKVALVPYSMGVNLAGNAAGARGPIIGSTNITNAVLNLTGTQKTISAATKARPVVITSNSHGFVNGDVVWVTGSSGMTQLNNKAFVVTNKTTNTFELYTLGGSRVDGRNYGTYGSGGRVQKCQNNDCSITITSANHGLTNNEYVYITDVAGMTELNNQSFLVGNVTTNSFTIDPNLTALTPYSSGGKSWCARQGCTWFAFENMEGDRTAHQISTCVTERTGGQAYTDATPSTYRVGRNYPGSTNGCLSSTMTPLSSSRTSLKAAVDTYVAQGSTAGQIGIAWGWYMVSPFFNSVTSAGAANYSPTEVMKSVVIMTDGEFNTPYCDGVIAQNSGSGSGANSEKNGCDANNGDPFAQGRALCDGMKAQNITVYTVGFTITPGGAADNMLRYCATNAGNYFNAASGADLTQAFSAIGRDITRIRISR